MDIVAAVKKAGASGRIALTHINNEGTEVPTHVAQQFVKKLQNQRKPIAFAWRKKGSTSLWDWKVCWDVKQAEDADVLTVTEIKYLYE